MIEGYYTAVSTMAAMMAEQQIIGNNLANLNTVGFKQDIPQAQQFDDLLLLPCEGIAASVLYRTPTPSSAEPAADWNFSRRPSTLQTGL